MAVKPIPNGYHTVTPCFLIEDAPAFIDFLKAAFAAVEMERHLGPDGRVAHAELRIGDSPVMVGSPDGQSGQRTHWCYLYVPDADATYKAALAAGAESTMQPENQFYGDRNCGVRDRWGNDWRIATHVEDVAPEEMERRMKEAFAEKG